MDLFIANGDVNCFFVLFCAQFWRCARALQHSPFHVGCRFENRFNKYVWFFNVEFRSKPKTVHLEKHVAIFDTFLCLASISFFTFMLMCTDGAFDIIEIEYLRFNNIANEKNRARHSNSMPFGEHLNNLPVCLPSSRSVRTFFYAFRMMCVCVLHVPLSLLRKVFQRIEHHSMFAKIHRFIYAYKIDLVFSFAIHSSAVICSVMRKLDSNVCVCWASLWHKFFSPVPPPHHNHRWINDARSECLYMFDNIFSFNYSLSRKTNFSPMHVMTVLLFFNFIHFVFRLLFHFCTSLTKRKSSSLSLLLPPTLYAHPPLLLFFISSMFFLLAAFYTYYVIEQMRTTQHSRRNGKFICTV